MSDVLGMNGKNNILGNTRGMITDSLKTAADENQIQIAGKVRGIILHPVDQSIREFPVEAVELLVAGFDTLGQVAISFCKSPDRIIEHIHGMTDQLIEKVNLWQFRLFIELAPATGDIDSLVGDALDIGTDLDGGNDLSQIGCHGLESAHHLDTLTIHLHLQTIDLFVVGNTVITPVIIALQEAFEGILEIAASQTGNHQHGTTQLVKSCGEGGQRVRSGRFCVHGKLGSTEAAGDVFLSLFLGGIGENFPRGIKFHKITEIEEGGQF